MKLVYKDPLEELLMLIEQSRRNPRISFIAVTRNELRNILLHGHAEKALPKYVTQRREKLDVISSKIKEINVLLAGTKDDDGNHIAISDEEQFKLFDAKDLLEKKELDLKDQVPKQIIEDGFIVKVTLKS